MSPASNDALESRSLFSKVRLPVTFLAVLIFALGSYYFLYVQKKATYLVGRNLRLLATLGDGIRASAESFGKLLESQNGGKIPEEIPDIHLLPNCDPHMQAGDSSPFLWWPKDQDLLSIAAFPGHEDHGGARISPACANLTPQALLAFLPESKGPFTGVFLARGGTGEVVYSSEEIQDLGITRLAPLLEPKNPQDPKKPKAIVPLPAAANDYDTEIGGRKYRLFIQPVGLPIGENPKKENTTWYLCGLVTADDFMYKALAIPSSALLLLTAVLLLSALSWPLVRLRLIGARQRVRGGDVLLLGLCTLIGVAIITLGLVDFYAYSELRSLSESQLQSFGKQMAQNLLDEIYAAHLKLKELEIWCPYTPEGKGYQWIDFAFVDKNGNQILKEMANGRNPVMISVRERSYFKHALAGDTLGKIPKTNYPFFLQSVTAWTTHEQEAVLAEPVIPELKDKYAVAMLSIPLDSVIKPVVPPGFEFAVIEDQTGTVLFHSNPSRNNVEHFFTEDAGNDRLRSAVFARRQEEMNIRYFGEDYLASLAPLTGLPWTVVALRSSEELRALNMEWVVTTALFLLLAAVPMTGFVLATSVFRPGYRAPWLWPDAELTTDYLSLAALLALYATAFTLVLWHLPAAMPLLVTAWSLPFYALLTSYIRLRSRSSRWKPRLLGAVGAFLGLFILLVWALRNGPVHNELNHLPDYAIGVAVVALILATWTLGSFRRPEMQWTGRFQIPLAFAYPLAGVLLLTMMVVLPTLGFFKAVHRIELDSFIRFGQIELARSFSEKRERFGFYGSSFFHTTLIHRKQPATDPGPCDSTKPPDEQAPLPEFLEGILPHYSLRTAQMRELLHDRAGDCSWDAHHADDTSMEIHNRLHGVNQEFNSQFPPLLSGSFAEVAMSGFFGNSSTASNVVGTLISLCLVVMFLAILFRLTSFISQRLFLVDLLEPLGTANGGGLKAIAGRNLFVVQKEQIAPEAMGGLRHFDLKHSFEDVARGDTTWRRLHKEIVDCDEPTLLTRFEHDHANAALNLWKLQLLEKLVSQRQRTIIIYSNVSPTQILTSNHRQAAPSEKRFLVERERWQEVLSAFTLIEQDLRHRATGKPGAESLLFEEGVDVPFLVSIAHGVDCEGKKLGRNQRLEEFLERAEGYYWSIWESCSDDERVVLQHLAQEGLVNEKNRRTIRRLLARGLVRRCPNFCLMNESFRRFVSSPICRSEVLALEQNAAPSAWDRFQWPFLATLSASLVFFFATQQELLDSTLALVTGLTAGLPTVTKLMDFLGGRKTAGPK